MKKILLLFLIVFFVGSINLVSSASYDNEECRDVGNFNFILYSYDDKTGDNPLEYKDVPDKYFDDTIEGTDKCIAGQQVIFAVEDDGEHINNKYFGFMYVFDDTIDSSKIRIVVDSKSCAVTSQGWGIARLYKLIDFSTIDDDYEINHNTNPTLISNMDTGKVEDEKGDPEVKEVYTYPKIIPGIYYYTIYVQAWAKDGCMDEIHETKVTFNTVYFTTNTENDNNNGYNLNFKNEFFIANHPLTTDELIEALSEYDNVKNVDGSIEGTTKSDSVAEVICRYYHGAHAWSETVGKEKDNYCCGDDEEDIVEYTIDGEVYVCNPGAGWTILNPLEYCKDKMGRNNVDDNYVAGIYSNGDLTTIKDGSDGCCGDDKPHIKGSFSRCVQSENSCSEYRSERKCPTGTSDHCKWDEAGTINCHDSKYQYEDCPQTSNPDPDDRCTYSCTAEAENLGCIDKYPYGCENPDPPIGTGSGTCIPKDDENLDCSSLDEQECKDNWFCEPEYYSQTYYNDFGYTVHADDNDYICTGTMDENGEVTQWKWVKSSDSPFTFSIKTLSNIEYSSDFMSNKPDATKKVKDKNERYYDYCPDNADQSSEKTRFFMCDEGNVFSGTYESMYSPLSTLYDIIASDSSIDRTCLSPYFDIEKSFLCYKENDNTYKIMECSSSRKTNPQNTLNPKKTRIYGEPLYSFSYTDGNDVKTEVSGTGTITFTANEKLAATENDYLVFDYKGDELPASITIRTSDGKEYVKYDPYPLEKSKDYMHFVIKMSDFTKIT